MCAMRWNFLNKLNYAQIWTRLKTFFWNFGEAEAPSTSPPPLNTPPLWIITLFARNEANVSAINSNSYWRSISVIDIGHTPVRFADSPLDIRRRIRFDRPVCSQMRTDSSNILYRNRRAAKNQITNIIFYFYNQNVVVDFHDNRPNRTTRII